MRIEPIGALPYAIYIPAVKPRLKQLSVVDIAPLLPENEKPATLWDSVSPAASPFEDLFKLLDNIAETKLDDFFFVQATKTVETPYTNRVRFAASPPALFINTFA